MADLGVSERIVDRILNHTGRKLSGTARIYNRSEYLESRQSALDLWAKHVMGLIRPVPDNVVPFAGRRAMTTSAAVYWSIPELFARVKNHNYAFGDLSLQIIPVELARTGRIHAIGRRCDDTGEPETQWTPIPCHEWGDLHIPSRSRRPPHYSDDVFWSSSGRRAWASVQFSKEDLLREWLGDVFARPRAEPIGDVVIPPIRDTPTAVMPPLPALSKHRGARSPALPTKCDTDGLYVERLRTFQKEHRYLSRSDDERWGRGLDINRDRVRELREKHIPDKVRRGGAPEKPGK